MNHKRSMRIFLLSFWLLLISGAVIIAVVYVKSHKNGTNQDAVADRAAKPQESMQLEQKDMQTTEPVSGQQPEQNLDRNTDIQDTEADTALQQTNGRAAAYQYEMRVKNGYLEIYYYHTDELFMHTGIPFQSLTLAQKQELRSGKYFLNEEELYGYLESCTS